MTREVVTFPDKRLKQKSEEVKSFDGALCALLDDMYDTMIAKRGVGLAAIQIGAPKRALIISLPNDAGEQDKNDLIEVVNPVILEKSGSIKFNEGCLSVPEYYSDIDRADVIKVEYFDRYGNRIELDAQGYLAVAFQHEIDHLDGHLFIDRLSILKRKKFEKDFKKSLKEKPKL